MKIYTTKTKKHTKDSWSQNLYLLFNAILKIEDLLRLNEILLCSFFKNYFLSIFYFFIVFSFLIIVFYILMGVLFVCLFVCFLFFRSHETSLSCVFCMFLLLFVYFCVAWLICFALLIMIESRIAQRQNIKPWYIAETVIKALTYFYIYS